MRQALQGQLSEVRISALLTALRMRPDAQEFLPVIVEAVQAESVEVNVPRDLQDRLVDTCGTGGDRSGSINISTAAAFVLAAAGVPVAKHGNRAASSSCGSADVLAALGAKIELNGEQVVRCIQEVNMGFFFAPSFHPGLRHVAPVRKDLGVRTVFNWIGPLVNPAGARRQVIGTGLHEAMAPIACAMAVSGAIEALVVRGMDGLDELSINVPSNVLRLSEGKTTESIVDPASLGIQPADPRSLVGGSPQHNADRMRAILGGEPGPQGDIVALNAAAGFLVANVCDDFPAALHKSREILASGQGLGVLDRFIELTNRL